MLRSKLALGLAVSLLVIVLFVEQEVTAAPEPCFGLWHHHKHKHKHKHKPEKKDDDKKDEKKDDKKDEKKDDKKDKDKKEKKEEDLKKIMDGKNLNTSSAIIPVVAVRVAGQRETNVFFGSHQHIMDTVVNFD
ncbi:hypothetical protein EVAR_5712_1 [Eumeta japonica]|uniref:Uncharacterized protein n=1 Tax=Eumeta variegata TaxID=151549 RepID=A0A4C1T886_EUMVA|nr:hypothetical protein EVAR_5712_1 [Eumeta japonica]